MRKERSKQLHVLSEKKKRFFYETQIGTIRTVLFEKEENEGNMEGFTENYIKVKTPYNPELANQFVRIQLTGIDRDGTMNCTFID